MSRVLISLSGLDSFEHDAVALIVLLAEKGCVTEVVVPYVSSALLQFFAPLRAQKKLIFSDNVPQENDYDLILVWQGALSPGMLEKITRGQLTGTLLYRHLQGWRGGQLPYSAAVENKLAWRSLVVSEKEGADFVKHGIQPERIMLFPYGAMPTFCSTPARPLCPPLKRVLYISTTFDVKMEHIRQRLQGQGISLVWLDPEDQVAPLQTDLLSNIDVVAGDGNLLVSSLCMGIPAFLCRGERLEGYIGAANLSAVTERHFFLGPAFQQADADTWTSRLIEGYEAACHWMQQQRTTFCTDWNLETQLSQLMVSLPAQTPLFPMLSEGEIKGLQLYYRMMVEQADTRYSFSKWAQERTPSATRVEVLRAFIQQSERAGCLHPVIIDAEGDTAAVQRTIDSVAIQSLAPVCTTVITDAPLDKAGAVNVLSSGAGIPSRLNQLIDDHPEQSLLVMPAGASLQPHALLLLAEYRLRYPACSLWYCDERGIKSYSADNVTLKPDCNLDLLRSVPYIGSCLLFDCAAAQAAGGINNQFQQLGLLDLAWRFIEKQGPQAIGHVPEVLVSLPFSLQDWLVHPQVIEEGRQVLQAHIRRFVINGQAESGLYPELHRLHYAPAIEPLVSIIIPTRDHLALLRRCIESLMEKTRYTRYELIIVDNQSQDADTCDFLRQLAAMELAQLRILCWDQPFSYPAMVNFAATQAKGEILLFLDNDCEIIQPEWLEGLLEHVQRPEIALVGGKLELADGRIDHGGYLLGVGDGVSSPFNGRPADFRGYLSLSRVVHNVTALSASCMMVRKTVFEELGGFTEADFPVYFADVDLGLKAQQAGYLSVWTPYVRVKHMGGATRLLGNVPSIPVAPDAAAFSALRKKWRGQLTQDICFHPLMDRIQRNFTVSERVSRIQPPLPGRPLPVVLAHHANWSGCGHHRVIKPFEAMASALLLEGGLTSQILTPMDVAQIQPDIILLELATGRGFPDLVRQYREVCNARIIVDYDDFLFNLPVKNHHRNDIAKTVVRDMRRMMECTDGVVVSTPVLADAYAPYHDNIRVAMNRLSVDIWGSLLSERRTSKKLRVGWAGGSSHTGDLDILRAVIKALAQDVEWVFMGMKPEGIQCEYHRGVPFNFYPEKLASLNLDLALVPLEINRFNECKSNLRLLEIGACGIPIIATDIEPYRCGLPVTLVRNRFGDWMAAIRDHLADPDALARRGDLLRAAVHQHWMLRDDGLNDWQHAWLDH